MKKSVLALTASLAFAAGSVSAQEVIITTGKSGGGYHGVFGTNLARVLKEQGHDASVVTSLGSIQNLDRVNSGEAHIGFTQGDAFAAWSKKHPNSNVEEIGSLGEECVFVATREDGIDDEDDIGEGTKIAVGEKGTGSAVSWDYLRTLEDDYAEASTFYQGGIRSLAKVASGQFDAFLWVTAPGNLNHSYLEAVNANDDLRVISLNDYSLNEKLPSGETVYEFHDVVVREGRFSDTEVETPCTSVLAVANTEMGAEALESAAAAIMMNANRIRGL
ncbi:TAXI family TRAP transporter solute-binding subunit [Cobetia sp. SIMBA_158]|uniref:TAXI family TRAP transporter solute-binding subunit n=1 Tax=Cobetia sp. SIMBA_158 TaxID=3081617 RepID=UPI00397E9F86